MRHTVLDFVGSNSTPKFYIPLSNFCSGFSRCLQSYCAHKAISQALCWSTQQQRDSTSQWSLLLTDEHLSKHMPMISSLYFNAKNLAVNRHVYYIKTFNFMYKNIFLNIFLVLLKWEWLPLSFHTKSLVDLQLFLSWNISNCECSSGGKEREGKGGQQIAS